MLHVTSVPRISPSPQVPYEGIDMDWLFLPTTHNAYIEALTLNVILFVGVAFGR